ncbi:MAG TPA: hypothetical protein VGF70_13090 [Solirubrobacteraceae bacterium]
MATALTCGLVVSACGGSGSPGTGTTASVRLPPAKTSGTASPTPVVDDLLAAEQPRRAQFPASRGRSLKQLVRLVRGAAQLGPGTSTYTTGRARFAFALTDKSSRFIYAPTAVYLARTPTAPAQGPFLAPADSTTVSPQFRSAQNSAPGGLKAVYWTDLPVPRSGVYDVLALTRVGPRLIGATGEVPVALSTPIPSVGQRPPDIATDTLASQHGKVSLVTTRTPPESMHSMSLGQVLGKRPVALLFSTPELCKSRVCGPVTDIMVELQRQFGSRIAFIHQEVYVGNDPTKGLRPQLHSFHLETEPWLFTINRRGEITARLDGVFGVGEARAALEAALR